jgi:iron complex outermembrane recepter protein
MRKKICMLALGALAAIPSHGGAEELQTQAGTVMGEVVVTASRTTEEIVTVPASVTVITAADIAATTAQTVPEVLKGLAGIQVADFMGTGRQASVDIRGFGETADSNTLVMVDGRKVNSPSMSGIDWTAIPLSRIERIEIVRGGGSVLYGNNATSGVINIITRKGTEKPTLHSDTAFGSYDYFKQALGLSGRSENWSYFLDAAYVDTDGYRDNGYFRNKTAGINLSYDDVRYGMNLAAGVKEDRYGLPGHVRQNMPRRSATTPADFAESKEQYVQLTPYLLLSGGSELSLALKARKLDSFSDFSGFEWAYTVDDYGISPQYTRELTLFNLRHRLVAGVDYQSAKLHYDLGGRDLKRRETGGFFHDRITLGDDLFLTLGYRTSRTKYEIDAGPTDAFTVEAATLGVSWNYAPGSKVFASADRAYRTMLVNELGGPAFNEILEPQISNHYQAGISHRVQERLQASGTMFRIDTQDEIFFDPNSFMNTNYGRTRRQGLELAGELALNDMVRLTATYTLMDNELRGGQFGGNDIPGVARHSAAASITVLPVTDLAFDVRARWVGKKSMISDWQNEVRDNWDGGNYTVVDTMLTYAWQPFTFYAGINNLFDEKYSEHGVLGFDWLTFENFSAFYPAPGRNAVAGLKIVKPF